MRKILLLATLIFLTTTFLFSQTAKNSQNQEDYKHHIFKTDEVIKVDGMLSEAVWSNSKAMDNFWYSFPVDDKQVEAMYQTEVFMTYDDKNIYIGAICHGPAPFVIPSLKRDNNQFWDGEVFSVVIDPVNERTNAMGFGTNPAGVQFETLIGGNTGTRARPSSTGFNSAWDNKWVVNSTQYDDKWITEMAIPFKTLKYGDKMTWGINFVRGVPKTTSWHTWAPVPVQFTGVDLGYTGALIWDAQPPKAKSNISVIPYILGSVTQDKENGEPTDFKGNVGGDAKIAINSNLNLDLTVNPDFSQVDVDEQVTNLTTVNIRFPERRLFFLENSDIFSDVGIPPMRPFFSRRIGLDDDGNAIPILYGARLSGNLTKDLRVGLMNLQTKAGADSLGQNYTAFAFNQRLFGRTLFKGYFHNRQAFHDGDFSSSNYNRVLGGELDYRTNDGKWRANVGYGLSLNDGLKGENGLFQAIVSYNSRNFLFYSNVMGLGNNYISDMGFMSWLYHYDAVEDETHRIGYTHWFTSTSYTIFPKNENIISHQFGFRGVFDWTATGGDMFIGRLVGGYTLNLANTARFEIEGNWNYGELFYPFAFTDASPLPVGEYDWSFVGATYQSDIRKSFFYELGVEVGNFYNGKRQQYSLALNYRQQPWGNFGMTFVQNNLEFPEPYGSTALTLIGPKIEVNFSRNLFWTTFLQYNTQRDNFNINSRLQWQFQPLSNLFVVYSDNYFIDVFGPKNRALVVKLNYWLNL